MIIDADIKPDRQLYVLGAVLLDILGKEKGGRALIHDLHKAFAERTSMGADSFFLALDWLYLLDAIEGCEGGVRRCS